MAQAPKKAKIVSNWGTVFADINVDEAAAALANQLGVPQSRLVARYGLDEWDPAKFDPARPYASVYVERNDGIFLVKPPSKEDWPELLSDGGMPKTSAAGQPLALPQEPGQFQAGDASPAEVARRIEANYTTWPQPAQLLHAAVFRQVDIRPNAPAVISATGKQFTYAQLKNAALGYTAVLQSVGVAMDETSPQSQRVGIVMTKGWEQVVAVLAILAAGAAYVPIEGDYPEDRLLAVMQLCRPVAVMTQTIHAQRIRALNLKFPIVAVTEKGANKGAGSVKVPVFAGTPDRLAYIIFTSGSTGTPKGVMVSHGAAWNTCNDMNDVWGIGPDDATMALSNLNFDLSVYDIFGLLSVGGRWVCPDLEQRLNPVHWADVVRTHGVTVWNSVPQLASLFASGLAMETAGRPGPHHTFKLVFVSGDWVPLDLPKRLRQVAEVGHMVAGGGATEAAVWSNYFEIGEVPADWTSIPYGKAMRNQQMYVLSEKLTHVPDVEEGEIFIAGSGLAQGYWADVQKSSKSFLVQPDTGVRLYRTGDLGAYLPSGDIRFVGRADFQVKVRGNRVELGEVETVMQKAPGVSRAVCDVRGGNLIGYFISEDDEASAVRSMTELIKGSLPPYMMPSTFIKISEVPLSPNGKVNKKGLPDPKKVDREESRPQEFSAKEDFDGIELQVADIFEATLGLQAQGRFIKLDSDFFEVGGSSQSAIETVMQIQGRFPELKHKIAILSIFQNSTVQSMAAFLKKLQEEQEKAAAPLELEKVQPPSSTSLWITEFALMLLAAPVSLGFLVTIIISSGFFWWLLMDFGPAVAFPVGFVFGELFFYAAAALISIVLKWVLVGRLRPGTSSRASWTFVRFMANRHLLSNLAPVFEFFAGTRVQVLLLRMLGCRVGSNVHVDAAKIIEWDLIDLGEGCKVEEEVTLTGSVIYPDRLELSMVTVDPDATLRIRAFVGNKEHAQGEVPWLHTPGHASSTHGGPCWRAPPLIWLVSRLLVSAMAALATLPLPLIVYFLFQSHFNALLAGQLESVEAWTLADFALVFGVIPPVAFLFITCPIFLLEVLLLKRLVIGRFVEAEVSEVSCWEAFREVTMTILMRHAIYTKAMSLTEALPAQAFYLRLMGAQVGKGAFCPNVHIVHHDLVKIGDYACFGSHVRIVNREDTVSGFERKRVEIGASCVAAHSVVICPGARMLNESVAGNRTVVMPDTTCEAGSVWTGAPAVKLYSRTPDDHPHDKVIPSTATLFGTFIAPFVNSGIVALYATIGSTLRTVWYVGALQTFGLPGLPLIMLGIYIRFVAACLVALIFKWTTVRVHREGTWDMGSYTWWCWKLNETSVANAGQTLTLFLGTPAINLFWRLMGMRIGRHVFWGLDASWEPCETDLITLGDNTVVGLHAQLILHEIHDHTFQWTKLEIAPRVSIGQNTFVAGGVTFGEDSMLSDAGQVYKGMDVETRRLFTGNPAEMVLEQDIMVAQESSWMVNMPTMLSTASWTQSARQENICIIGGGVSGMVAAYECWKRGMNFTILDQNPKFGGVWVKGANTTSYLQQQSQYYLFEHTLPLPDYAPQPTLVKYFADFMDKYGLDNFAQLGTQVTNITPGKDADHRVLHVAYQPVGEHGDSEKNMLTCDGVVIACGKQAKPNIPSWGKDHSFKGRFAAFSELDSVDFKGKRVIIVGGAASAIESLRTAYNKGAKQVTLLARRKHVVYPRQLLPLLTGVRMKNKQYRKVIWVLLSLYYRRSKIEHMMAHPADLPEGLCISDEYFNYAEAGHGGRVEYKIAEVQELEANGALLTDGSRVSADVIVVATGWEPVKMPFLKGLIGEQAPRFYKSAILMQEPKVGAVGVFKLGGDNAVSFPIAARLNTEVVMNNLEHVSCRRAHEEMRDWIRESRSTSKHQDFEGQFIPVVQEYQLELQWQFQQRVKKMRQNLQGMVAKSKTEPGMNDSMVKRLSSRPALSRTNTGKSWNGKSDKMVKKASSAGKAAAVTELGSILPTSDSKKKDQASCLPCFFPMCLFGNLQFPSGVNGNQQAS